MEDMIKVSATISKAGYEALMEGKGIFGKGGIIDINTKRFIELYQPVILEDTSNTQTPTHLISTMVDKISDIVGGNQLQELQNSVGMMNTGINKIAAATNILQTLNVINTAVSVVNCGISVVGFQMMKQSIGEVKKSIDELSTFVQNKSLEEKITDARNILLDCQDIIQQCCSSNIQHEFYSMTQTLNRGKTFLETIIDDFNDGGIQEGLAFRIIFQLSPIYIEAIQAYCSRYYYTSKEWPVHYEEWLSFIDKINDITFKKRLKMFLYKNCPTLLTSELQSVYNECFFIIDTKIDSLIYYKEIIPKIDEKTFYNMSDILYDSVVNGEYCVLDFDENKEK